MNILQRNSNNINIATFWENYQLKKYEFDPIYQRESDVWTEEKKSFLIDTILKNFPMPPIFLHQLINVDTGKTIYDVIDGKQRLLTIIGFINNEIQIPEDFGGDEYGNEELNGLFFRDFDNPELSNWKSAFWKYELTIEYIDTDQAEIVNNIFDRLNRNGTPLTSQELRKAKHYESNFYKLVLEGAKMEFWQPSLNRLQRNRLEDHEFISELLFILLKGQIFGSDSKSLIDGLFEEYANADNLNSTDILKEFSEITKIMEDFKLDLNAYSIQGVSHLYALFGLAWIIYKRQLKITNIDQELRTFFTLLREKSDNTFTTSYKVSMSAGTKSRSRREARLNALLGYLKLDLYKKDS